MIHKKTSSYLLFPKINKIINLLKWINKWLGSRTVFVFIPNYLLVTWCDTENTFYVCKPIGLVTYDNRLKFLLYILRNKVIYAGA